GDSSNFLFTLLPTLALYRPTSYNTNYQYFNYAMATLPNGLGFGGQMEYFGLWIDASFESGHSKAHPRSSTYGNLRLSGREEFSIDYGEL
ncbi:TLDc domain-containing protein, partial [Blyttiomyces helicus]